MRGLVFAAAAALLPMAGGALAATQIKQPECGALAAWGSHVSRAIPVPACSRAH